MRAYVPRIIDSVELDELRNENARLKAALKSVHADRCCNPSCTNPGCVELRAVISKADGSVWSWEQ